MGKLEPSDDRIISTTDARQGVSGHNVNVVLTVSLLLAVAAGVLVVGYFRMYS